VYGNALSIIEILLRNTTCNRALILRIRPRRNFVVLHVKMCNYHAINIHIKYIYIYIIKKYDHIESLSMGGGRREIVDSKIYAPLRIKYPDIETKCYLDI